MCMCSTMHQIWKICTLKECVSAWGMCRLGALSTHYYYYYVCSIVGIVPITMIINSFIPVSYLALLPLIPMFLYAQQSFHSWVFIRKKSVKEGMWVWVICVCKLLVKPWQPIYRCVGKWSQKTMVTLSESLSPGGWHTGANKGDTYPF